MIKQDGNVLVHQPTMREPINWQPPGSTVEFRNKDDHLIINSRHRKPDEKMKIVLRDIQLIIAAELRDTAILKITGMEEDVVNQIIESPNCIEEGLRIKQREKQVKSGMIDLFGFDKDHTPVVIEVKRSLATISSVHQLRMYVKDLKQDAEDVKVRGILCAPRIPDMVKYLCKDYELEYQEIDRKVVIADENQKTLQDFL
jgi:RecB family endonuclease NucS